MRNKNNPLGSLRADLPGFKRSSFQRGNKVSMTMALGGYYPVENYEILSGSRVELKLSTKLESFPALSPLYNSVRLRYDVFFCPYRLYIPNLFNNNNNDDDNDILGIQFPVIKYPVRGGFETNLLVPSATSGESPSLLNVPTVSEQVTIDYLTIPYGSVLEYLNYPQFSISFHSPNSSEYANVVYYDYNVKRRDSDFIDVGFNYTDSIRRNVSAINANHFQFNLIPWLAYIDTYARYIVNPQDEIIPVKFSYLNPIQDDSFSLIYNTQYYTDYLKIQDLQNIVSLFRDTNDRHADFSHSDYGIEYEDGHYFYQLYSSVINGQRAWNPFSLMLDTYTLETFNGPTIPSYSDISNFFKNQSNAISHLGILPSTYLPDYFNSGISLDKYQNTRISLSTANYIDQLRLKERQWAIATRFVFGNGSYTDWNYTQYMSNLKLSDYPIHLGSDTINFSFQDILSQTNSTGNQITDFVGGTAGKASFDTRYFDDKFKTIKFTAREPGLLLITARLVPEVDYTSGVPKHLMKQFMSDIFLPENDAVGFDDMFAGEFDYGVSNPYSSIWKTPFGWEYMKSYNKSHSLFRTDGFSSWTFQRTDTRNYTTSDELNYTIRPEFTTYILPEQFGDNFADVNGIDNDHYGLKIGVDLNVYQPMSKSIINFSD